VRYRHFIKWRSLHGGHVSRGGHSFTLRFLPSGGNSLPRGVEVDGSLTVEVAGSPHGGLVSSEGEHRKWDGKREVKTDLSGFNLSLELSHLVTVLGEASDTVTPGVLVDEFDSFFESLLADNAHDRSENFFIITGHALIASINDGGSNPVTIGVAFNLGATSIEEERGVLLTIGDESLNVSKESLVVGGTDIVVFVSRSNGKLGSFLDKVGNNFIGISDKNYNGDSHASLTGRSEASTSDGVDGIIDIGIG